MVYRNNADAVYRVVCYKLILVWNIITSKQALSNQSKIVLLFSDSVLGQEENINLVLEYHSRTHDRAIQKRYTSQKSVFSYHFHKFIFADMHLEFYYSWSDQEFFHCILSFLN